ncbi:DUF3021 family protein [Rossellomorea vietnamensis]|jgi:Protein of unknown function (DUF3021)|uniref:DUF3021 family protein n=1 Tax=Rossellomorea vietnamensis TaxID=218284 RepID=A0A6I6UG08_9BACI|nr:DUF3021 domain-containing protein [Rossellomorea vietnamensis]QHE60457.1 DUF3021 family protein [Rossellomorea vietnamensis]
MNLLKKGLIRGLIPFILFTVTSLMWTQFEGTSAISKQLFLYGLIAFFLGVASVIYEVERWRFIHQIVVHYLVMLVTVFPTLLLSGAYPVDSFRDIARVYFLFNQMGLILFLSTYFLIKWRNRAYMREQNE